MYGPEVLTSTTICKKRGVKTNSGMAGTLHLEDPFGDPIPRIQHGDLIPRIQHGDPIPRIQHGDPIPRIQHAPLIINNLKSMNAVA